MFGAQNSGSQKIKINFPGVYIMKFICHSLHLECSVTCKKLPKIWYARFITSFVIVQNDKSQFYQFQKFLELQDHKILHPLETK